MTERRADGRVGGVNVDDPNHFGTNDVVVEVSGEEGVPREISAVIDVNNSCDGGAGDGENAAVCNRLTVNSRTRGNEGESAGGWNGGQSLKVEASAGRRSPVELHNECVGRVGEVHGKRFPAVNADFGIARDRQSEESVSRAVAIHDQRSARDQVTIGLGRRDSVTVVVVLDAAKNPAGTFRGNRHHSRDGVGVAGIVRFLAGYVKREIVRSHADGYVHGIAGDGGVRYRGGRNCYLLAAGRND